MLKRRLFLLLAVLLPLLGFAQAKSVPYFSQIGGTSKLDADWTVYNVNGDEKTWINDASPSTYSSISAVKVTAGAKYVYNTKADANDWLVSPAIHLEADKEYKVSFYVKTSGSFKESLRLAVANANTADAMATKSETLLDFPELTEKTFVKKSVVYVARESGDYYFGFYEYSKKDLLNVLVTAFSVAENITTPAPVTGLTATEGANEAITVDLKWTLPTKDEDGNDLTTPLTGVESVSRWHFGEDPRRNSHSMARHRGSRLGFRFPHLRGESAAWCRQECCYQRDHQICGSDCSTGSALLRRPFKC